MTMKKRLVALTPGEDDTGQFTGNAVCNDKLLLENCDPSWCIAHNPIEKNMKHTENWDYKNTQHTGQSFYTGKLLIFA